MSTVKNSFNSKREAKFLVVSPTTNKRFFLTSKKRNEYIEKYIKKYLANLQLPDSKISFVTIKNAFNKRFFMVLPKDFRNNKEIKGFIKTHNEKQEQTKNIYVQKAIESRKSNNLGWFFDFSQIKV